MGKSPSTYLLPAVFHSCGEFDVSHIAVFTPEKSSMSQTRSLFLQNPLLFLRILIRGGSWMILFISSHSNPHQSVQQKGHEESPTQLPPVPESQSDVLSPEASGKGTQKGHLKAFTSKKELQNLRMRIKAGAHTHHSGLPLPHLTLSHFSIVHRDCSSQRIMSHVINIIAMIKKLGIWIP